MGVMILLSGLIYVLVNHLIQRVPQFFHFRAPHGYRNSRVLKGREALWGYKSALGYYRPELFDE